MDPQALLSLVACKKALRTEMWSSKWLFLGCGVGVGVLTQRLFAGWCSMTAKAGNKNDGKCVGDVNVVCECGVKIGHMAPEEVVKHREGDRHQRNLRRSAVDYIVTEDIAEYRRAARDRGIVTPGESVVLEVPYSTHPLLTSS